MIMMLAPREAVEMTRALSSTKVRLEERASRVDLGRMEDKA